MPENIISPGNKWFTNDLTDNDTVRKRRDVIFEDGEIAREGSWPWVVAITGNPKQDYCHVGVVPSDGLCEILNYTDANLKHAEYNDLINLEVIQEMAKKISCVTQSVLSDPILMKLGECMYLTEVENVLMTLGHDVFYFRLNSSLPV